MEDSYPMSSHARDSHPAGQHTPHADGRHSAETPHADGQHTPHALDSHPAGQHTPHADGQHTPHSARHTPQPDEALAAALADALGDQQVRSNEPLAHHTTFQVGGPADLYCIIESRSKLQTALALLNAHNAPYFVLGRGSNLLVSDKGYRGVVLEIADSFSHVETRPGVQDEEYFICDAGLSLKDACEMACSLGLSGMEFACGIPGTVGGGIHQNAGAYGGALADVLESAELVFSDGTVQTLPKDDLKMGYRCSLVAEKGHLVTRATFLLKREHREVIREKMDEFTRMREEKQPLDMPSAGSTFKRPGPRPDGEPVYVGPLIQQAGLQGYRIGGAEVSQKHAGFVVNAGGATAQDIYQLIRHIQRVIKDEYHISLEPEVQLVGEF